MIASLGSTIKPAIAAAVLLIACELTQTADSGLALKVPKVLALTGASRSQAYEMRSRLVLALQALAQPPGRREQVPAQDSVQVVTRRMLRYVLEHPGCVRVRGKRRLYSDAFRRFVVELFVPGGPASLLTHEQVAEAIEVPLGTLKDWLRTPDSDPSGSDNPSGSKDSTSPTPMQFAQPQIATLLSEYQAWEGGLSAFCEYARNELALPYGRGFITSVLVAAGLYRPTPRNAPHQAPWSRGSLRADFPGQQWFGDGKQLRVILCGRSQLFNLEAMVDGASNAVVGVRVTDAEDASAVVQTFEQGLQTTQGQPPLAVTLDNRPSNFSPQIDQALSCTELLRATPGRGEAKAPVEGAFGLFEQSLPGTLIFEASTTRELMRVIAQKVAHAFFAGRNGRPRARLGGKSPAQAYDEANPCAEQIESAKSWIEQLRRKELIARQSREQRADPVRRQLLAEQLAALGLEDSGGQFALSLSGFALGAILHGIAIFRSKKELGSLPIECDPYRYLAGIIRNIDTSDHLERQANHLLELRLRAGDLQRAPLVVQAQSLRQSLSAPQAVREFVSRALSSTSVLEFRFWTSESKSCLASLPTDQATALFPHLARVITSTFKTDRRRRERLIATLAEAVAPVAA